MKISVFGLGYVGTVSAACFAARGHRVIGVDVNRAKVELISSGQAPIVEPQVGGLISQAVSDGRLNATTSTEKAIAESELSIVCVGMPSAPNGSMDTQALRTVCQEIGAAIAKRGGKHIAVIRSTMAPGTFQSLIVPTIEAAAGRKIGPDLVLAVNPEFLREGTAVADFNNAPRTVIGATDPAGADLVAKLYEDLPGPIVQTTPELAEIIKYLDNPWHALKVAFANEIGNVCKAVGVDSQAAMDIFFLDQTLNISKAYLRPGFAFGGSCLPKDLRGLCNLGQRLGLELPVLQSILPSNTRQIERAVDWILSFDKRRIAVLGCTFKEDTDDLRESPYIILIERLLGKGIELRIFDHNLRISMLMGANRDYLLKTVPHIAKLLVGSAKEAIEESDLVLLTAGIPEYLSALPLLTSEQQVVDFANVAAARKLGPRYHGINW